MTASEDRGTVLLVESDPDERDLVPSWLGEAGYDVTVCPGPTEPDYTCVGARTGACPLATEASVVILDMSLENEALMTGTAAEELLALYLFGGHRVVALGSHAEHDASEQLCHILPHVEGPHGMYGMVTALIVQ